MRLWVDDQFCPGEKFVQHMVRVVKIVCEEIVLPVSSLLRWRGIVGAVQTKSGE